MYMLTNFFLYLDKQSIYLSTCFNTENGYRPTHMSYWPPEDMLDV